jgi:Fe-S cluster biogenesis protein NfuA
MAGTELMARVEELGARVEDPVAGELVSAVMDMYAEGLRRVVERDPSVASDPYVASLLLIHDLHPTPLQERVQGALESVRPFMARHGGDVELVALADGVLRLRLLGTCNGCAASATTLEAAVEKALEERAPDLAGLEVEGAVMGVPLPMVQGGLTCGT